MKRGGKISVLFFIPTMHTGGAERVFTILLKYLDRRVFEPTLALVSKKGELLKDIPSDVEVIDMGKNHVRNALIEIVRLIWRERPEIVFSSLTQLNVAMSMVRYVVPAGIRFIARETSIASRYNRYEEDIRHCAEVVRLLYATLYKRMNHTICQSRAMKDDLVRWYGFSPEKLTVINNPIDCDMIMARARGSPDILVRDRFNVVAVGRLAKVKGYDLLLSAAAKLKQEPFHFTIVGHGEENESLQLMVSRLGVKELITFAGFQANPYPFMAQADLLVSTSQFEGFPNAVAEAMACGTPVVAFGSPGGMSEVVIDGVNGRIVEYGNIDKLAAEILKFSKVTVNRDVIRKTIQDRYDAQRITRQYENVFLEYARTEGGRDSRNRF